MSASRGELLALRWRDVDTDAATIAVARSVGVVRNAGEGGQGACWFRGDLGLPAVRSGHMGVMGGVRPSVSSIAPVLGLLVGCLLPRFAQSVA